MVFRYYDGFIYVSPLMSKPIKEMFPDKPIKYIGNFVDTEFFSLVESPPKNGKFLLCVASLRWQKDIQTLIAAYAHAISINPDVYPLKIVGIGPQREELENLVAQLKLGDRISFEGSKSRSEIFTLMSSCHFFILSSIKEGFPKVVLEALACGKFVVTTKAGALSSILNNEVSSLVNVSDSTGLGDKIAEYSATKFDYAQAKKCRAVAEQYSIRTLVSNVSKLYKIVQREYE